MICEQLSDRMPEVALGRDAWAEDESRHLETCGQCSAEWTLISRAAAVGRNLEQEIDVGRISGRVLHRLTTEPAARRLHPRWVALAAVAAAALLLVVLRSGGPEEPIGRSARAVLDIQFTELDSLNADQLKLVLESIEDPLDPPSVLDLPSLMDLDDQELERILHSMEG